LQKSNASTITKAVKPNATQTAAKSETSKNDPFKVLAQMTSTPMTNKQAFSKLAEISGKSESHIRRVIASTDHTPSEISKLFENAKKSDIRPNTVTPVFKHLIEKGHVKEGIVKKVIHQLHRQNKLTQKQKEKVISDLS